MSPTSTSYIRSLVLIFDRIPSVYSALFHYPGPRRPAIAIQSIAALKDKTYPPVARTHDEASGFIYPVRMEFTTYSDTPMSDRTGRHFTVAVFVVHKRKVLLHHHRKLDMWLPPGGHIEENELPDDAALREVHEEAGIEVKLIGERRTDISEPRQLHRPAGVQLEHIAEGHYHIDLIYFARPTGATTIREENEGDRTGFYAPEEWGALGVNAEVRGWCERALREVF